LAVLFGEYIGTEAQIVDYSSLFRAVNKPAAWW
jgi:hypothetical protein